MYALGISLALVALGHEVEPEEIQDRYYLLVFASQADPVLPRWSHTFAAFVKVRGTVADIAGGAVEPRTISWLPADGVVGVRLAPQAGRNFDLPETLAWARRQSARVMLWGPFEVDRELYELAERQIERLEAGAWQYRMLDGSLRSTRAVNCQHAVMDLVPGERLATGTAFGEAASALAARHFRRYVRNPEETHDWLLERLDLQVAGLLRRGW